MTIEETKKEEAVQASTTSAPTGTTTASIGSYDFSDYKKDALTKPRDLAWDNWMKFEKLGDHVSGFIADVFYRPAEGLFDEQRGITLKKTDGSYINVGIKRLPFVISKTNDLHIGDPLTVELSELKPSSTKGFSASKIFSYYGKVLAENMETPTVLELEAEDMKKGGTVPPKTDTDKAFDAVGAKPEVDPNKDPLDQ